MAEDRAWHTVTAVCMFIKVKFSDFPFDFFFDPWVIYKCVSFQIFGGFPDIFFVIDFFFFFLAVLGLCFCTRAFSNCSKRGLLFVVLRGLLIAVASLVVEHGL